MKNKIKDISIINFLIIPISVSINVIVYQLSQVMKLPILLDSIGTLLSGILGGPIIGALTGILSTFVNGIINPIVFAYLGTSIIIGLLAGLFSKLNMLKNPLLAIIAALVLSFFTTIFSGIVTFFVFGGATTGSASLITVTLVALGNELLTSVFSAQLFQELVDKSASIMIAYLIIKTFPPRLLIKFEYGERYIHEL